MSDVLKHRFVSAKADGADATQVQPSNWNDGHKFQGGNAGEALLRDPTDATFGAVWGNVAPVVVSNTATTGLQNNIALPGVSLMHLYEHKALAEITIGGFTGTFRYGDLLVITSHTSQVNLIHQNVATTGGFKLRNWITGMNTTLAGGQGRAVYSYNADGWLLIAHDQGDYVPWAVSWVGGVTPVLGNGTLVGRYYQTGRTIKYQIVLTLGSTTVIPTGYNQFQMPCLSVAGNIGTTGSTCIASDALVQSYHGLGMTAGTSGVYPAFPTIPSTGRALANMTNTHPFTWGVDDSLIIRGEYLAA